MTTSTTARRPAWFVSPDPSSNAPIQAFLFPHAGGTALMYRAWAESLSSDLEIRLLQLPGRQERLGEPVFDRIDPLVEALQEEFEAELDGRPYIILGHSFGAILAYRLTQEIEASGGQLPALLAMSGWAPGISATRLLDGLPDMTDEELMRRVAELGLAPDGIPADPGLLAAIIPSVRGDLTAARDFRDDGTPVSCPIAAYHGTSDPLVESGSLDVWAERTPNFLGATELPGGHFYLFDDPAAVRHSLDRHLRRLGVGA